MHDARPLAVFDVDGVLADVRHRLHLVERRPKDWDGFFAAAPQDPPLAEGVQLARASAVDCEVGYVTGRPERCRQDTLEWFRAHELPAGRLAMRDTGDRRPARVAKPQLLRRLARGRTVALVVDDDAQVCAAYEQAGWRVLHATWMSAERSLFEAQELEGRS